MSVKSWLQGQAIRSMVGQIPFREVRVNKWILAAVATLVALGGGLAGGLEAGQLSVGAIFAAAAAGLLAGVGKLYDPGAVVAVPRLLKALGLGLVSAVALVGPALQDNVINASEWGGIAITFFTVAWAKWSTPDKITT